MNNQNRTLESIKNAHKAGKTDLKPGSLHVGKDKDHIYLKTKNVKTGREHHVAIHKSGKIANPDVVHNGKFNPDELIKLSDKKVVASKSVDKRAGNSRIKKSGLKAKKPAKKDEIDIDLLKEQILKQARQRL